MLKKRIVIVVLILTVFACVLSVIKHKQKGLVVKVGMVDTCLNADMMINYNIKNSYNLVTNDIDNHGDMIVDTFRNQDKNSELYYACAMNKNGCGDIGDVIDSLKWLDEQDVDVICLSLTTLTDNELLRQTIREMIEDERIVVAACLNYSDTASFPATYPGVISVSNCSNDNATISITDKKVKEKMLSYKWNDCSTSSLTAFITGKLSAKLFKGHCDIQEFADSFKGES